MRDPCRLLLSAFVLAAALPAQGGNGGNGDLHTSPLAIGTTVDVTVSGGAGRAYFVYLSDAPANLPIAGVGTLWLDPTSVVFGALFSGAIGGGGTSVSPVAVPNDPSLLTLVLYLQGVVFDPGHPSGLALTRAVRVDFETPDSFAALPPMNQPRALGTADLLPDGRILAAGGGTGSLTSPSGAASTEIFDPYTRTWVAGPNMSVARGFHASVRLPDGRVFVCGGVNGVPAVVSTCEIYDPTTGTWGSVASMTTPRAGHGASLLQNGRILVTGGITSIINNPASTTPLGDLLSNATNTGEVYDPLTNVWTPVANTMASNRFGHTQTLLNDGRVASVSGLSGVGLLLTVEIPTWTATTSLYNAGTNSFSAGPAIGLARAAHRATRMPNGEIFVSGGLSPVSVFGVTTGITTTSTTSRLNAGATAWSNGGNLPVGALLHGQALLPSGRVHVSGGTALALSGTTLTLSATDACATRAGGATTVTPTTSLPQTRGGHLAVSLWDGSVLIAGGGDTNGVGLTSALLYTPAP